MKRHTLQSIIDIKLRLKLYVVPLVAVFFLAVYSRQVCPFIDSLPAAELLLNLMLVYLAQMVVRELMFDQLAAPSHRSLARHGFYLSAASWAIAGLLAMMLHEYRYPDFPLASHLKLLSAYWILGSLILSQLDYTLLEQAERKHHIESNEAIQYLESMSQRILEGFFLFTLAPSLMMLLVVGRYVYERLISVDAAFEVAYIGIFCICTALFVAYRYGQHLKKDIQLIIQGIRHIEQGRLAEYVGANRFDELGEMSHGINQMAKGLQLREKIKEAFGKFVDPNIAESFIQNYVQHGDALKMGGERRKVAVLMCDIRDFTSMAEEISPEELTELLNGYFSEMVVAIQQQHGIVDKFIGDAVMAVFGLVDSDQNAALQAVHAGIEMQARLSSLNQRREQAGKKPIANGIGIHIGDVVAGYIGSHERLEFTVIGATVNLAARIESQAKLPNPPLLFSQQVADQIQDSLAVAYISTTALKGVREPVKLFTLDSKKRPPLGSLQLKSDAERRGGGEKPHQMCAA